MTEEERKRKAVERATRWAAANPERVRVNKRNYIERNRFGKVLENKKRWQKANPEKARAACRKWSESNPGKNAERRAVRRAFKVAATVPLTPEQKARIAGLYAQARAMSRLMGEPYHVDHIKPLSKGGLHHPDNLQVLLGRENLRKGAKYG